MALIDQDATIRALVQLHEETGVKTAQKEEYERIDRIVRGEAV